MNKIVTKVVSFFDDLFTKDIGDILSEFDRIVLKIEKYVGKASKELEAIQSGIDRLQTARDLKNSDLDRAFRSLHNISQLVK